MKNPKGAPKNINKHSEETRNNIARAKELYDQRQLAKRESLALRVEARKNRSAKEQLALIQNRRGMSNNETERLMREIASK